ncbi:Retinol dehydrogenase 13 [Fusarium oxysporum f. sp. albedinis]|nr:Retinol dehydrogenase 13 [Fusarium oxysporum f. sp. albedinis]
MLPLSLPLLRKVALALSYLTLPPLSLLFLIFLSSYIISLATKTTSTSLLLCKYLNSSPIDLEFLLDNNPL